MNRYRKYDIVACDETNGVTIVGCVVSDRHDNFLVVKDSEEELHVCPIDHTRFAFPVEKMLYRERINDKQFEKAGISFDEEPEEDKNEEKYYDSHYAAMEVQPIEIMQMLVTPEEFIGYLKCSIVKYRLRAGHKEGESEDKDTTKMKRYIEWLTKAVKGEKVDPRK